MHLIKTERPQEVIQKSLHDLMTDLGLGNVLSQKISCFAAKHFTKITYFSQMKKRKNIKMLIPFFADAEFYCFFSSSLIAPM